MPQWDTMVNWREEFESKRRFEAARRLFYSHPSVAVRCRSLHLRPSKTSIERTTTSPNSNLPSITHSIEGIKLPITANPKAASAPSILRSQKSNQLLLTHQQRTAATPPVPNQMMITSSMLTSRQILPTITNKTPAGNNINKNYNFSSSKDLTTQQKDVTTTPFDNTNIPLKGWGQRCQSIRPSLHPPPEDIELSIRSIEPVLKNITLNDTLLLHNDAQEEVDTVLNVNPPQTPPPQLWRQEESVILSKEPNKMNDEQSNSQPTQSPLPDKNNSSGAQLKVTFPAPTST